jgi:hypothetical protein
MGLFLPMINTQNKGKILKWRIHINQEAEVCSFGLDQKPNQSSLELGLGQTKKNQNFWHL